MFVAHKLTLLKVMKLSLVETCRVLTGSQENERTVAMALSCMNAEMTENSRSVRT